MDEYYISQPQQNKHQAANHYHSSLEQPNLGNVQAKLYAIRQKNQQMAQSYFQGKYGSPAAYNQFLQQSNLSTLLQPIPKPFQQTQQIDMRVHLENKARQIKQKQLAKIMNNQQQNSFGQKRRNSTQSKKINPWNEQKVKGNKITTPTTNKKFDNIKMNSNFNNNRDAINIQQQQQQQDYLKNANNNNDDDDIQLVHTNQYEQQKKGQFINQFKQYLANKKNLNKNGDGSYHHHQQSCSYNNTQLPPQHQQQISSLNAADATLTQSKVMNNSSLSLGLTSGSKPKHNNVPLQHDRQGSFSSGFINNSSGVSNLSKNNNQSTVLTAQEQLVKKIFKNIHSKNQKAGSADYVEKIELAEYLTENQRILTVLNTDAQSILYLLQNQLQTKDPNKVKPHQCLFFIYQLLGNVEQQKKILAKHNFNDIPDGCMIEPQIIKQFERTFKQLDKHKDLIVKRLQFIEKLALNPMLKQLLNAPAVYEPHIDKTISMRRIFQRIEVQALLGSNKNQNSQQGQNGSNSNQYISWSEFLNYFTSGHTQRAKYDILRLVESLKTQSHLGFSQVPQVVFQVLCNVISKLDKGDQYFNTQDLVAQTLINKLFQMERYTFVRGKNQGNTLNTTQLSMQTFQQVLMRIKQTAPKYLTIKEFMEYFSERGQPIQIHQKQIQQKIKKSNKAVKVTVVENEMFPQKNDTDIEGYDSDPQFYNNSNVYEKKQFRKSFNYNNQQHPQQSQQRNDRSLSQGNNRMLSKNYQGQQGSQRGSRRNDTLKVTVPKPFKFEQRQKARKQQSMLNRSASQSRSHSATHNYRFKPKQIPSKVKEVGLFDKMMMQKQKQIQQRRKCSMLLTLANEEPFSFYNRKAKKKTHQQRADYQFKANPIPWYCSVNLLQKKQEKNINRNEKIARMAQQSLNKAKLPPRMEKDYQEKLARKNLESAKKPKKDQNIIRAKQPPNFQLLHQKFQNEIQRKRKQNKTTEIKQFKFQQANKKKIKQINDDDNGEVKKDEKGPENWKKALKSSINVYASSTAKFDQQVQKRRMQMEEKKRKKEQKEKEDQKRAAIDQQLKKRLDSRSKIAQKKQQSAIEARKKEMKTQNENFKNQKAEWIQNAKKQPLLVQRPLQRDVKIQRMKKLHQISETLKKNGIKGKQHNTYFTKEEILLLQDYENLKDKI